MKAIIAIFLTFVLGSFAQSGQTLTLSGTAYDFSNADSGEPYAHPDFNSFGCGVTKGICQNTLGADLKPVYNDGHGCVTSEETFNQWFRPVPGVNQVVPVTLVFYWDDVNNAYTYTNTDFFPLDGQGWGNEQYWHNFGFCLELHTSFTYEKGQVFNFMGDDDVWVFINGQLVIDLGGVHGAATDVCYLDSLGLTEGQSCTLDFFFCERHIVGSDCVISTSITLNPCGTADADGDGIADLCDQCPHGDMGLKLWADDQIGANNGVTFHVGLTTAVVGGYPIRMNFGDNANPDNTDPSGISGWVDYVVTNGQLDVIHNYAEPGDYNILVEGVATPGCGVPGPTTSMDITCGSKRLAPKCSSFTVVPGATGKRKRSL